MMQKIRVFLVCSPPNSSVPVPNGNVVATTLTVVGFEEFG